MLKRTIEKQLLDWKNRPHHPLIIAGMRQIGKTFSVRKFGNEQYQNVVYLDLRADKNVHTAFTGNLEVNRMVSVITASQPGIRFIPDQTLLILDEIQDCPNARSSLKYWDTDGRYDVIATGSFLGVKGFRQPYERGIPVGYEEQLDMHSLSFREFLDNYGMAPDILEYVQGCIDRSIVIDPAIHNSFRRLYLEYLIVGGMPEAVSVFLENHDVNAVQRIQRQILRSVRDDFGRYIDSKGETKINEVLKLRAEACLDSLPAQLSKEYKKFQYSLVNSNARSEDKADALQYLADLGLVLKSYNLKEISVPLEAAKISKEYKVFYSDIGLLVSQLERDAALKIINGELGAYKGAIAENMCAIGFHTGDKDLYYYRGRSGSPELDFVVSIDGEPSIVECKSTNNRATSMKYVINHPEKYGKHPAVKISDTNIGFGEGFKTYPIYYPGFFHTEDEGFIIPKQDFSNLTIPDRRN
ncbi:MAG: ATP-binding protein [Flexilinea sp.]|nr:ATP-binding protein [Flexilinea sp.]